MEITTQTSEEQAQLISWKREVEHVRQDVKAMRARLESLSHLHLTPGSERMVQVEHFQNQFIRQLEVADEMFHDLKQSNRRLNNAWIEHHDRPLDDLGGLRERMGTFHKLYNELRHDFTRFEAHR